MPTPAARIMETALALHRAPGERFRLRERPVPAGIVHAMEIAAASPQVVQETASETGEPEANLIEAARFYLEQLLFADPEADAYRVLGLARDATPEAIRTHHRWLQRWLHPDRAQAGDASVFATRVNQAFAQLRTPEARHAYDVRLAETRLAAASAAIAPEAVRHWEHEDEPPRHGRRSRWLLLAALAACAVLAVLVVRNPDRSAPWDPDATASAAEAHDPGPAMEDSDLGVLGAALAVAPAPALPAEVPSSEPAEVGLPAAIAPTSPREAAPAVAKAVHKGVVSTASTVPASPPAAKAAPLPPLTAVSTPPVAVAADASEATAATGAGTANVAGALAPAPRIQAASQAATPPPPAVSADEATLVAARLPMAQQRVAQLAGYLASQPRAVPLWDNVQAMAETNDIREQINVRKGGRLELGRPAWRMRPEQAVLNADYRCRSGDGSPCAGRLEVVLVWREGMWLVRGVSIGPAA